MGDTCKIKCDSNAIFYEYKDKQARTDKEPTSIYVDNAKKEAHLPNKYNSLFEQLMGLDGDAKTLSAEDLALGKGLMHEHGIKDVRVDKNNGVSTFVFKDDSAISVDMKLNEEEKGRRHMYRQIQIAQNNFGEHFDIVAEKDPNSKETGFVLITAKKETAIAYLSDKLGSKLTYDNLVNYNPDIKTRDEDRKKEWENEFHLGDLYNRLESSTEDMQPIEVGRVIIVPGKDLDVTTGLRAFILAHLQ